MTDRLCHTNFVFFVLFDSVILQKLKYLSRSSVDMNWLRVERKLTSYFEGAFKVGLLSEPSSFNSIHFFSI